LSKVGLVLHQERREAVAAARKALTWLVKRGHDVRLLSEDRRLSGLSARGTSEDRFPVGLDLVVSLGGDGTMLRAVRILAEHDVPILGVNLGQLGYLTEIEPPEVANALEGFFAGRHRIEERMLLSIALRRSGREPERWIALNEAVVERPAAGHTVQIGVELEGDFFTTYAADGLIVATPTGSTAYSLSARGPIVAPDHRAILLTPVSPHQLFDRTLILNPEETVRLTVRGHQDAALSIDGKPVRELAEGDAVECTASPHVARLVTFGNRDFHQILKSKFDLADRVKR
jgi:NAD+ kinase